MKAFVSGAHSGPNPSPGYGVAQSIRSFYGADIRLIAVDYSPSSSALHSDIFDEVVEFPSWSEVNWEVWESAYRTMLNEPDSVVISTLDLEARQLAATFNGCSNLLVPPREALARIGKPPIEAGRALQFAVADYLAGGDERAVETFLRRSASGVWAKGAHYEARRVWTMHDVRAAEAEVRERWNSQTHYEAHLDGQECGIAFAGLAGVLVDAVFLEKRLVTADGKTWSGGISELEPRLRDRLSRWLRATKWHGGGELELVRSWDGNISLIEVNPRFPAWIHGGTVSGINLPAALVTGSAQRRGAIGVGFTRVVNEVPIAPDVGLAPFRFPSTAMASPNAKHPSGMPMLANRVGRRDTLMAAETHVHRRSQSVDEWLGDDEYLALIRQELRRFTDGDFDNRRVLLAGVLEHRIDSLREGLSASPIGVEIAYSVKTAPHPTFLRIASGKGLLAEAISQDEALAAVQHGFPPGSIVLNGPAKWWPRTRLSKFRGFFADSMDELRMATMAAESEPGAISCSFVGLRVSPLNIASRFGASLSASRDVRLAAHELDRCSGAFRAGWGLHLHHASSVVGPHRWVSEADRLVRLAETVGELVGKPPAVVDLGGGWHPDDGAMLCDYIVNSAAPAIRSRLGAGVVLIVEPGKLLTQPAAIVLAEVLAIRAGDVVTSTSIAEVPEAQNSTHRIAAFTDGFWRWLPPGTGRLLGRTCMEHDVLATSVGLDGLAPGSRLCVADAGGYDLSMAFPFGVGGIHEP